MTKKGIKVVGIFWTGMYKNKKNYLRGGIQEPRWPRASNTLCTPLLALEALLIGVHCKNRYINV